ncbi:hypothetical protein CDL60_17925 [Roseateles noduli]|nr:hypothetical protein CDL60_17925 [Roseateles noduli]
MAISSAVKPITAEAISHEAILFFLADGMTSPEVRGSGEYHRAAEGRGARPSRRVDGGSTAGFADHPS